MEELRSAEEKKFRIQSPTSISEILVTIAISKDTSQDISIDIQGEPIDN